MSRQVFANQTSQFKHRDLIFAKHGFKFGIGVDGAFVGGVLQALRLDVVPQLFSPLLCGPLCRCQ